ncbi:MAG: tRNA (adenosine(37)-N6)-threonylcarbamoyltransferase complex dimerization subunit type 1 TsaB [Aerococcaceae bacterium]|nr:tRNA (adenosine(37)-N6)-threonylcarbamoyltransferase complex dimerization subunit type 1 TsaB [Aerococcaceae bacterium]
MMMRTIAVDTSTSALSVALLENQTCIVNTFAATTQQHGERLLPEVAHLFEPVGWQPSQIERVVVGVGPGSYTGLRIGVTFAKTWSVAKNVPLTTVSSLALLAAHTEKCESDIVVPLMDARRMSAYTAAYRWQNNQLVTILADCHADWEDYLPQLAALEGARIVFVGEKIGAFVQKFQELYPQKEVAVVEGIFPNVALLEYVEQTAVFDPTTLAPNYAHATVAEQEWLAQTQGNQEDEWVEQFS